MFGPEYFTVAGYEGDGFIVCRNCGEAEGSEFTAEESISVASANESFGEDGLYCDTCGETIVELLLGGGVVCRQRLYGDTCGEAIVEPPPPYKVMERYTGDSRFYPRWEYETMAEAEEQLKELAEDEPEQFATGKWKLEGPDD